MLQLGKYMSEPLFSIYEIKKPNQVTDMILLALKIVLNIVKML